MKQRKSYNFTNDKIDEESESDQANNVVTFNTHVKDIKGVKDTGEPSHPKNMRVTCM